MKRNKEIHFEGSSPLVSYDSVYGKKRKQVFYKLI